jgi:tight adherence protein B
MSAAATVTGAVLAASAAAGLLVRGRPPRRLGLSPGASSAGLGAVVVVAGAAGSIAVLDGVRVVLALVSLAVLAAVSRELRRRRHVAAADRRADLVVALCEGLAADLRAGQPPGSAMAAAAEDWAELAPVAAAAQLGADVPQALRELAARAGAGQLRVVAAAWQVGHRSGAGLAGTLAAAADQLRAERATARVVATELAAAQATARLLAVLPVGVLLLGNGLGGDPVGFLLDTPPGLVCLCAGLALEYAGLCWLAHIADQVTGRRRR